MQTERFSFPGSQGGLLSGRLDAPDEPARATALFAHCFTCTKDLFAANRIAAGLVARGFAVLRFDFTGLGSSEGEFANTGFSSNVADLVAAADHLRSRVQAPALLIGHSLGGAAVLAAAERVPEARAVATLCAPFDVSHVIDQFSARVSEIETHGEAVVQLAGRPFTIRRGFLDDVRQQDQAARIARLGKALLVMHAPLDGVVGVDNARAIFDAARHPKSFVSLDTADHLLTRHGDAAYVAEVLSGWASRYLPPGTERPRSKTESDARVGTVSVEETGGGRFQQRVRVGPHRFLADEPVDAGGEGTGPSPFDLLLASLGVCTSMTLRLYAERKQLPLGRVRVDLERISGEGAGLQALVIRRTITLQGALTEEERSRLLTIANRCPVHKVLTEGVAVETELEAGA